MNHINIQNESSNITEYIDSTILEKLYNLFSGEITPTELDSIILDNASLLKGNLTVPAVYKFIYDWLLARYPDTLRINYNDLYIYIKDPYIEAKLIENNFGDSSNSHVLYSKAFAATTLPIFGITDSYNVYEENITEFKELAEFTNVKKLPRNLFRQCRNIDTVDLRNVTELDLMAFYRSGIRHCLNSGNIEIIGNQCLEGCTNLETFDFSSVRSIGNLGVINTKLTEIHFNGSENISLGAQSIRNNKVLTVIDGLQNVKNFTNGNIFSDNTALLELRLDNLELCDGNNFVNNCSSLHTFYAPKFATKVEYGTFDGCKALTNLTIDWENITTIKGNAFANCTSLTSDKIDISHVIEFTGGSHFSGCTSLTSLTLNPSIISIPENFCFNCTNLSSINLSNIVSIGKYSFKNCTSLTSIDVQNVTTCVNNSFNGCKGLTTIDMPNATTIGEGTFNGCTALTSVNIPNCTNVGGWVFKDDTELITITGLENFVGASTDHLTYNNCSKLVFPNQINVTGEYIGYGTFYNCKTLKNINLSSNTHSLYNSAFQGCTNLVSITGLENIQYIGLYAFYGCANLEGVINLSNLVGWVPSTRINNAVQGGQNMLFANCPKIIKVIIGQIPCIKAESLGGDFSPFKQCTLLHTVDITNITDYIQFANNQLFWSCDNIKNLVLRQNSVVECKIAGISSLSINNICPSSTHSTFRIYVPDSLVNDYKTAENWSNIESYIRPLSEYVEITD